MRLFTSLTKDDAPFYFGTNKKEAFKKLKARVADSILVVYPDPTKSTLLREDFHKDVDKSAYQFV